MASFRARVGLVGGQRWWWVLPPGKGFGGPPRRVVLTGTKDAEE